MSALFEDIDSIFGTLVYGFYVKLKEFHHFFYILSITLSFTSDISNLKGMFYLTYS